MKVDEILGSIAERFANSFPAQMPSPRAVGREAEFPLVRGDGRAADVSLLWSRLLESGSCVPVHDRGPDGEELLVGVEGKGWSCVAEVGRATVELSVGPRATLHELADDMQKALQRLQKIVHQAGLHLLGFGIQPRTPASVSLLTPKQRYLALLEAIGTQWLTFCITAGDQVQIDIGRGEIVQIMNIMNAASGAIIALTANSSVYRGRPGKFASGREGLAVGIVNEPYRHGSAPRPYKDLEEYIRFLAGLRCLCIPRGDHFEQVGEPFTDFLQRDMSLHDLEAAYSAFLFHEHYVWPSARPRARIGTLEIRPACQQPHSSSWMPSALALGLIESANEVGAFFESELGRDRSWEVLLDYRRLAIRYGLEAPEPVPGFLRNLLDLATTGLQQRGYGEEVFIGPAWEILAQDCGPATQARRAFERGGIRALVQELSLP